MEDEDSAVGHLTGCIKASIIVASIGVMYREVPVKAFVSLLE